MGLWRDAILFVYMGSRVKEEGGKGHKSSPGVYVVVMTLPDQTIIFFN